MQEPKVALVTGSSSGIGFETAILLARSGYHIYASMRNIKKSKKITDMADKENLSLQFVELDVNNDNSVKDAIDKIVGEKNRIDVLVNNAGYGLFGSLEDMSLEEIKSQFETNFFGVIRVIQNSLPIMRKQQGGGFIVNISSVGGRMSVPVLSAYNSTKFALEGMSESLSYELEPFGIRVVIIEPGFIRTNIMNSSILSKKSQVPNSPYFSLTQKVAKHFNSMVNDPSSTHPEEVAKTILKAITSESRQLRYTVGNDADSIIQAKKTMLDADFENLIKKQFQ
ncbi:MAG TPA: SDR family oxidoreductase [Bacillus sp. (in: firmicutes)]|nr:SDR family oxidoreductase [Bacillus sp. (in: firmicutes)]